MQKHGLPCFCFALSMPHDIGLRPATKGADVLNSGGGKCRVDLLALMTGDPKRFGGAKRLFSVEREGVLFGHIACDDYAANCEWKVTFEKFPVGNTFTSFDAAATYAEQVADAYKGAN